MANYPPLVRLISHEGEEFAVEREIVLQSKTFSMFLSPELGFQEALSDVIRIRDVPAKTLRRIVDFLVYRKKYDGVDNPPPWDIKAEESLDLLLAADYLEL